MLDIAKKLEEIALKDQYFIDRSLYPNVDFYSGLALKALGIPNDLFTAIFAMSRTAGWIAHFLEAKQKSEGLCPSFFFNPQFGKFELFQLEFFVFICASFQLFSL